VNLTLSAKLVISKGIKMSFSNNKTAINILNAFMNHVEAQSGKRIREDLAGKLIVEAKN